jgi:type VI secretion system secreted protein VgrG
MTYRYRLPYLLNITFILLLSGRVGAATNAASAALEQGSVIRFSGREAISQPFEFEVDLASPEKALNFATVVGQTLSVRLAADHTVHGMAESIEQVGLSGNNALYRIRLVPTIVKLKGRTNSRTFYDKDPQEIVAQVLSEAGISAFEFRISGSHPVRELAVQYQESDFAFISRILEAEGIHYHFEFSGSGHKVVFGDANNHFPMLAGNKLAISATGKSAISQFSRGLALHPGRVDAGDYNWLAPKVDLTGIATVNLFQDLTEQVRPAGAKSKPEAQRVAQMRLAANIASAQNCGGDSGYTHLQAGSRFVLQGHYRADFNQEYVLVGVEHEGTPQGYRNSFRCLPANLVYRPQVSTPRPVIAGVVPAVVVGPSGEERFYDEYGRVKVVFPWQAGYPATLSDPAGDAGWVRVAQIGGGMKSPVQAMFLPTIGAEVAVAFEHGDPDRPLVIGTLYTAIDMPPYDPNTQKYSSGFKSLPKGGVRYSEIRLDSTTDAESVLLLNQAGVLNQIRLDGTKGREKLLISGGRDVNMRGQNVLAIQGGNRLNVTTAGDLLVQGDRAITLRSGKHFLTIGPRGISASTGIVAPVPAARKPVPQPSQSIPLQRLPSTR